MSDNEMSAEQPKGNGLAIGSLVCGILGFCVPLVGIAALVLGIIALAKKTAGQGMAIAGTVLGGLSLLMLPIIAAIAIPSLLAARRSSLETNAVGSCRAYVSAQIMYHKNDWDGNKTLEYAADFSSLNTTKDPQGNTIQLLDGAFAAATSPASPKHGYYFVNMKTIGDTEINWANDFALCAVPAVYGRTGYRTFIVLTNGTIFGKDLGPGGKPVVDYPVDPIADGWIIAE